MKFTLFWIMSLFLAGISMAEKPSVLVTGYLGISADFLIDPVYQKKLEDAGYKVGAVALNDLTPQIADKFNVIILLNEPVYTSDRPELAGEFTKKTKLLLDYVNAGGGLLIFFDEMHYTPECDFTINTLLKLLDAKVGREEIIEKDSGKTHEFKLLSPSGYYKVFRTEEIASHTATKDVHSIWWPMFTGVIESMGPQWKVVVRASATAETAKLYREKPPLLAVRDYGKGRVALFMGLSSFYVNNGYHIAYENGFLMENGDGARLFANLYKWLGEPSQNAGKPGGYAGEKLPAVPMNAGMEITDYTGLNDLPPQAGIFGVHSNHSGGAFTVAQWAQRAKSLGLKFIAFTDRIETRDEWNSLVADCNAASDSDFVAIPGVEFRMPGRVWQRDKFVGGKGNIGFAVNIDKWPPSRGINRQGIFIDTLLTTGEQHPGIYVYAAPAEGEFQAESIGGYNAYEVISSHAAQPFSSAVDRWQKIQANPGMSAGPIVSERLWALDQLDAAVKNGFKYYLFAENAAAVPFRKASDIVSGFVSNGPIIERFWAEGILSDPWERYFMWNPGDIAVIHLRVSSEHPLTEVCLHNGNKVIRTYHPDGKSLEATVHYPMSQDGPFWLEARDQAGKIALSYAIPTRNWNFWNHVGSDRMNDYHNPILPDPHGKIVYKGKRFGHGGLVTFGYGWGLYCRFYHAVPDSRYHPQGYETGQINAGVGSVDMYSYVEADNTNEQAAPLIRRSQTFATRDVAIVHQIVDSVERETSVSPVQYLHNESDATLWRYIYNPWGTIVLEYNSMTRVLREIQLKSKPGLEVQLASISYRGLSNIEKVSWIDPSGKLQTAKYDAGGVSLKLGKGGFVTLWPDRFGLVAVYALDHDYDVFISGDTPMIQVGYQLDGQKLLAGREFPCRLLVCQEAGGMDVAYWQKLRKQWGLAGELGAQRPKVAHGEYLKTQYVTAFTAKDGALLVTLPKPEILVNELFPVEVDGMNPNWTACVYRPGEFYPAGIHDEKMYVGLSGNDWYETPLFLGHPIVADNAELAIEIHEMNADAAKFVLYNPTSEPITTTVKTNPAWPGKPFSMSATVQPGEEKLISQK